MADSQFHTPCTPLCGRDGRRHSELGDGKDAGGGSTAADAEDLPRSWKRPRVKLEREGGDGSNSSLSSATGASRRRGPVLEAPPPPGAVQAGCRSGGSGRRGGGQSSREEGNDDDDDDDDDPLAPYARIEAETVSDDGLEELLHTGRRDGYLDLRRYRKPGWPRPLRVTRLEASHGKR